jgi:hypothetical protein
VSKLYSKNLIVDKKTPGTLCGIESAELKGREIASLFEGIPQGT